MGKAKECSVIESIRLASVRTIGVKNVLKAQRLSEAARVHRVKIDIGVCRQKTGYTYSDYERLVLVVFNKSIMVEGG